MIETTNEMTDLIETKGGDPEVVLSIIKMQNGEKVIRKTRIILRNLRKKRSQTLAFLES